MNLRVRKRVILIFLLSVCSLALFGCASKKEPYIVSINDERLYLDDFLYDIYLVEQEGNQLEQYYQENLKTSYWDYTYQGSTMRQIAKNSILAEVVMNYILADQADRNGLTISDQELSVQMSEAGDTLRAASQEELDKVGLTQKIISASCSRNALARKYRNELEQNFTIDEANIRDSLASKNYSSEEYEKAVKNAIETEKENQFEALYDTMKDQYDITINFEYWDTITIGTVTVPEEQTEQ